MKKIIPIADRFGHKTITIGSNKADIYALLANFSTLSNLALGFVISFFILIGKPIDRIIAMRFLMLGASFDAIDGRIARLSNTKPRLGAQFDTLADQFTFAFAPGLMIVDMYHTLNFYFAFFLSGLYLFSASFRLSRFMLEPTHGYFKGMPSPVAALFVGAWYVLNDPDMVLAGVSIALISAVMISSLPYTGMKKVQTKVQLFYFIFTVTMMLLLTYSPSNWFSRLSIIWIVFIYYFSTIGALHGYYCIKKQQQLTKK